MCLRKNQVHVCWKDDHKAHMWICIKIIHENRLIIHQKKLANYDAYEYGIRYMNQQGVHCAGKKKDQPSKTKANLERQMPTI